MTNVKYHQLNTKTSKFFKTFLASTANSTLRLLTNSKSSRQSASFIKCLQVAKVFEITISAPSFIKSKCISFITLGWDKAPPAFQAFLS